MYTMPWVYLVSFQRCWSVSFSRNKLASKREAKLQFQSPVRFQAHSKEWPSREEDSGVRTSFFSSEEKKEELEKGGRVEWGWVHESLLAKQQQQHHRHGGQHPATLQGGGCWGDSAHSSRGQARGQQLLLEGEVVHRQVVSQVWDGDGQKRRGTGECKRCTGIKRRMESIRTNRAAKYKTKMWKHKRYVCHAAQCPLAAVKTIKRFRGGTDFHLRRPDATSYCGKHVLNRALQWSCRRAEIKAFKERGQMKTCKTKVKTTLRKSSSTWQWKRLERISMSCVLNKTILCKNDHCKRS